MPNDPAGRQEGSADARSSKGSLEVSPLARAESRIDKRSFTTFTTFTGPGESEVDPDEGEVSPLGGETGETGETCCTYAENVSDGSETSDETLNEGHGGAEEQEAGGGQVRANLRSVGYHVGEEDRAVTHEQLVKEKREEILRIASKHGARDVRVFGSVARGEADRESDIDFLVELEAGRSLLDLGGMQMELKALLGCRVDVVTVRGLKARIRDRVLREAMPV